MLVVSSGAPSWFGPGDWCLDKVRMLGVPWEFILSARSLAVWDKVAPSACQMSSRRKTKGVGMLVSKKRQKSPGNANIAFAMYCYRKTQCLGNGRKEKTEKSKNRRTDLQYGVKPLLSRLASNWGQICGICRPCCRYCCCCCCYCCCSSCGCPRGLWSGLGRPSPQDGLWT